MDKTTIPSTGAARLKLGNTPNKPARSARFHPFLPRLWSKPTALRWLKKVHAWTGLWGAVIFLFLGVTGILLNHKSVLKIDTGAAQEVMSVIIAVDPNALNTVDDLGIWAAQEFGTPIKPSSPRATGATEPVRFMGRVVSPKDIWKQRFYAPNSILLIEYVPGGTSLKVTKRAQNGFGFVKNLHKVSGMGLVWVLFMDFIAGALIAMTITGTLLWSRLHGSRLLAGAITLSSCALAFAAIFPRLI